MIIKDCNFTGINFDKNTIECIDKIAQALLNLTDLFKAQNVQIDCLLKAEDSKNKDKELLSEQL